MHCTQTAAVQQSLVVITAMHVLSSLMQHKQNDSHEALLKSSCERKARNWGHRTQPAHSNWSRIVVYRFRSSFKPYKLQTDHWPRKITCL